MTKKKSINGLFEKSGDVGPQPILLKMLKDKFVDMNLDEFGKLFVDCTMSVIVSQSSLHCSIINNMIKFAANGVSVLCEHSSRDGRTGMYLMTEMIRLCRKFGHARDKNVRWRFCLFLNHLLNYMAAEAALAVELCDVVTSLLLDRLKDKKPEIRTQAAHALNRLQTPDNPKCRIVEQFLFHMVSDPSSDVRMAITKKIAMFNKVIDEMIRSTLVDVSDIVKKEAFNRFLTYPFSSLSSKQRQAFLEKGLKEGEIILSLIKKRLLPKWFEECNNDHVHFLTKLGVENEIVSENTLKILFETCYDSQVLDLINKYLNPDTRMIDFDELTIEKIFLWKCVAKYLTTDKKIELVRNEGRIDDEYFEILLPDLIVFSDYIRNYYFTYDSNDKEFILTQLLDMAKIFSIDDVGAKSLNKLCLDLILDNNTSVRPIKNIVELLNLTLKNGRDILIYVKQILNEIQSRTIDIYPIIDKVGKKEMLEKQLASQTEIITDLIENDGPDSNNIQKLILRFNKMKVLSENINILPEENASVDVSVKNLLKAFELVFEIQQLSKVGSELSLLTDIIQNIVVGYLECSMVNLRMQAIRSLSPYLLANNPAAAKVHITTLCSEISKPMTDRHLLFKIMFELFLRYDLKLFDISDDLDTDEEYEDVFGVVNILPLLSDCIDYEVVDTSFKLVVIKGFCDLLLFGKIKSIKLLTKLLIIWFRHLSRETFQINNYLVEFFTSYVFNIDVSSSALTKCYVPFLREVQEHNLVSKFDIKLDEVNTTLVNMSRGVFYQNPKLSINSHGELAGYILDYLVDENQPYTDMLIDTLFKLQIDFDNDDELVQILGPKLMLVIKHFKKLNTKESKCHLKKIVFKFDPVLEKKASFMNKNLKNSVEVDKKPPVASCSTQKPNHIREFLHSDLFSQVPMNNELRILSDYEDDNDAIINGDNDDDEEIEVFSKLDAMKRMSEMFKKSYNSKILECSSSESD